MGKIRETFNPYQEGFFSSYEIARVENFQKQVGIKLHFSTLQNLMTWQLTSEMTMVPVKKQSKNDSLRYHILS